ncbi:MAG TPA: branched-chain-amino-acid transaminase [Spirochaetales bacterium]|nr:branched-chain-amino-acid transaminase [Spirochaetales bacterium]
MAKSFSLQMYPWVYYAHYEDEGRWSEKFIEKPHTTPQEEAKLPPDALQELLAKRNSFPELPLVNYSTQYGLGVFEGMKAFPQKDGSLKLFRPDENAKRMHRSMEGILMPPFPVDQFISASIELTRRNKKLGYAPVYDPAWEKDNFANGHSIYMRPFTYSEPAIGLGVSHKPWVVIVATPVGAYFEPGSSKAVTTDRIRATPKGTGWIKCCSNYVIPILAKNEAERNGYMEVIFLDAKEGRYVEEGSSCNIFFYLKNGTLVTPELKDTVLPGITRKSILTLAQDKGIKVEERLISIEEVMDSAKECFLTGTAAGATFIESITHRNRTTVFNKGKPGELTLSLQRTLKGIQYGALPDKFGWMVAVPDR